MSQIHYRYISLEETVERSPYIVVAQKVEPFVAIEKINTENIFQEALEKNLPPYDKVIHLFYVVEILKDKNEHISKGMIKVSEAHFRSSLKIHRDYYQKGLARSPEYEACNPEFNLYDADEVILFLRHDEELAYAFELSYESIERKKDIKKLIRQNKKKIPGD